MARKKANLDPILIKELASINCTMDEIAACCRCSKRTLERNKAIVALIEEARQEGKSSLKRKMWHCAMGFSDTVTELVATRKEVKMPDGKVQKITTKEPIKYERTYAPNTGMQMWLSKQMLGYSEKIDPKSQVAGTQTVTHKWVVMGKPGDEKEAGPEEIKKAQDEWLDQN